MAGGGKTAAVDQYVNGAAEMHGVRGRLDEQVTVAQSFFKIYERPVGQVGDQGDRHVRIAAAVAPNIDDQVGDAQVVHLPERILEKAR